MRKWILTCGAAAGIVFAFSCADQQQDSVPTSPSFGKGGAKIKSVSVTPPSATLGIGQTVQLKATPTPASATTTFSWSSSNTAVATVGTSTGFVTAVGAGNATITASGGGVSGSSSITVTTAPPNDPGVVLVGAGDVASCASTGDEATANLIDGIDGTVFLLGDNAYESGTATEYANCYGPSWGRHKARTKPSPGNHEYNTANATGYYGYFGTAAGDPTKGYYSYDVGAWHIIVLNSGASCGAISCAAGSPQEQWLRADLAAHANACTLAYWHHPRYNSGAEHPNFMAVTPLWKALYEANADVILNGHEHIYERFAPQDTAAKADAARGIRQFTVGTGGRSHYGFGAIQPNSEVRNGDTYGVLKLTLRATSYDWQFVPVAGGTFTDSGTGTCH